MSVVSKAVPQPASGSGPATDHRTGIHEGVSGIVINCLGVHAPHNRNAIGDPRRNFRKNIADLLTALSDSFKYVLRTKTLERLSL